ncbi:hypothetical protein ADICYQ_1067 [Cyclobacterium qasimii M12-11B]|uniref:Uncharacterized protein n=1 Tax=Cyclobacterium qasimii M12-11B TaxID=641524 RepID=S7X255_9BACT|nr:hypothetical protein ADICYQ_1067 [Cyclobacterium qasimii M12-11B]
MLIRKGSINGLFRHEIITYPSPEKIDSTSGIKKMNAFLF